MDATTFTSIVGAGLSVFFATSVAFLALDENRREQLFRFWKKWISISLLLVIGVNSAAGIYLFIVGPPQLVRSDILKLLLHIFNICAVPILLFMDAMHKVLDARDAKRSELAASIEALTARIEALGAAGSGPEQRA